MHELAECMILLVRCHSLYIRKDFVSIIIIIISFFHSIYLLVDVDVKH